MLKQILTEDAKARLARVALVKPDNARAVEEHVIKLARAGKLQAQVDESSLIKMLEDIAAQVTEAAGGAKKIVMARRKNKDEDAEEDDDDF
jgi:programmed cell death protein 5